MYQFQFLYAPLFWNASFVGLPKQKHKIHMHNYSYRLVIYQDPPNYNCFLRQNLNYAKLRPNYSFLTLWLKEWNFSYDSLTYNPIHHIVGTGNWEINRWIYKATALTTIKQSFALRPCLEVNKKCYYLDLVVKMIEKSNIFSSNQTIMLNSNWCEMSGKYTRLGMMNFKWWFLN